VSGDIVLDVTRLIWRRWRGGLPTGIDRVCLAYLEHFGPVAKAVVQRKGLNVTFSARRSRQLFDLLLSGERDFRRRMISFGLGSVSFWSTGKPSAGAMYLNVGHTGLDEPSLPAWIERHRLRAIYLIHDLIPITHPQFCRPGEDGKHVRRMTNVLASASGIIANSRDTANEMAALADRLAMPMPPTVVAWLSGNALKRAAPTADRGRPYFLVLGTIEGRKNHRLLLEVWHRLVERLGDAAPKLVIVGTRGWEAEEVTRQLDELGPLQAHVEEHERCSDDQLAGLMASARALLMPSFAEGYGLPVFEALELGTPVIAADLPVYREVAGAIPEYLPPGDVDAWVAAILDYIHDDPRRNAQIQRMSGFKVPDWSAHFATVEQWLDHV
jgi:glycosyltransferase involved in cell wall biosynthesis